MEKHNAPILQKRTLAGLYASAIFQDESENSTPNFFFQKRTPSMGPDLIPKSIEACSCHLAVQSCRHRRSLMVKADLRAYFQEHCDQIESFSHSEATLAEKT